MAKTMDPILPILSLWGYWAIILGSLGGPGMLLMIHTLHDLVYQNLGNQDTTVYIRSCRVSTINRSMSLFQDPRQAYRNLYLAVESPIQPV